MEGLELIRLFSDSKEKFVELRLLKKEQKDADLIKLMALKEWFEGECKSVEDLLNNNNLKFVDKMMLEKLEKDYHDAIQNINTLIK
jgi:hypothetical protein